MFMLAFKKSIVIRANIIVYDASNKHFNYTSCLKILCLNFLVIFLKCCDKLVIISNLRILKFWCFISNYKQISLTQKININKWCMYIVDNCIYSYIYNNAHIRKLTVKISHFVYFYKKV